MTWLSCVRAERVKCAGRCISQSLIWLQREPLNVASTRPPCQIAQQRILSLSETSALARRCGLARQTNASNAHEGIGRHTRPLPELNFLRLRCRRFEFGFNQCMSSASFRKIRRHLREVRKCEERPQVRFLRPESVLKLLQC
jgi:hypothetical protein